MIMVLFIVEIGAVIHVQVFENIDIKVFLNGS